MAPSAIPGAITGLYNLCNAQTASGSLVGVKVTDGPPVEDPSEERYLYIGHNEDPNGQSVFSAQGSQDWQTMGGPREERFDIVCCVISRSGTTDIKTERDRAYAVMGIVENLIRINVVGSDTTLGGAVLVSHIAGSENLLQLQTKNGAYVKVAFHVECIARI